MTSRDWYTIKEEIYYYDGSWRDIYVLDTTRDDWAKWIELINKKYVVEFYNGRTQRTETAINKQMVFDYWERKTDLSNDAVIRIGGITLKCHFFISKEIENDFDPSEIETIEDHNRVMSYLTDVSKLLSKTVLLTAENQRDLPYVIAEGDNLKMNVY